MADYEQQHTLLVRELAPGCTLFLKRNGDFPLDGPGDIALYGSGGRRTLKGGTGSGDVNVVHYVTAEEGMQRAGFCITTTSWLDAYDKVRDMAWTSFVADIKRKARKQHVMPVMLGMGAVMPEPEYDIPLGAAGDTAVYVLSRICGEGNDRRPAEGDFKLTRTEIRDILKCNSQYRKFILVLNVGGPVDLSPVLEVPNILLLSQLGTPTGDVLADILLGKAVPSGKLTTTWAREEDYPHIGSFGDDNETLYREGIYVGYRYFDSLHINPTFPFGFGLGFTDFRITPDLDSLVVSNGVAKVMAEVANTGTHPGRETVQLYITAPWGKLDQPYQKLVGYCKTEMIEAGSARNIALTFNLADLASYDTASAAYVIEKGRYIIRMGNSSRNTAVCGAFNVPEDIVVWQLSCITGTDRFSDWKPEKSWEDTVPDNINTIEIGPDDIVRHDVTRDGNTLFRQDIYDEAVGIAGGLSDEDLTNVCIGAHKKGGGLLSVIGEASSHVAGAAGESYGEIADIPYMVMADGPAGIRISRQYTEDARGVHAVGDTLPAGMTDFLPWIAVKFMKLTARKPKGEIHEQRCTAIPIGTALAQSWDIDLCERLGDMVGSEMETFGIDLWLAPGMNIHRSPLCGRNFEYYSEDPLLSGHMAAGITRGVQRHKGRGTTIKHFCANNQENNRYQNNSEVSERALREIYLKGFEICIRESRPLALMTSYNLLNGVHTSERADLCKGVLRSEWDYHGLIMTDWVVPGMSNSRLRHRVSKAAPTLKAGNDLFMPGNDDNCKEVMTALSGKDSEVSLTRQDLIDCAVNIIYTALLIRKK